MCPFRLGSIATLLTLAAQLSTAGTAPPPGCGQLPGTPMPQKQTTGTLPQDSVLETGGKRLPLAAADSDLAGYYQQAQENVSDAEEGGVSKNLKNPWPAEPPLEGTLWRMIVLPGIRIATDDPERQPKLKLIPEQSQAVGNGGCNRFFGGYQLGDGDRLTFDRMANTRMYCQRRMETEQAMLKALADTRHYVICSGQLRLSGEEGNTLAVFEADTAPGPKKE